MLRVDKMSESSIKIENVVASTKLAEEFDLTVIESEFEGAEYNKQKFPGLVYRVSDLKLHSWSLLLARLSVQGRKMLPMYTQL